MNAFQLTVIYFAACVTLGSFLGKVAWHIYDFVKELKERNRERT